MFLYELPRSVFWVSISIKLELCLGFAYEIWLPWRLEIYEGIVLIFSYRMGKRTLKVPQITKNTKPFISESPIFWFFDLVFITFVTDIRHIRWQKVFLKFLVEFTARQDVIECHDHIEINIHFNFSL